MFSLLLNVCQGHSHLLRRTARTRLTKPCAAREHTAELRRAHPAICPVSRKVLLSQIKDLVIKTLWKQRHAAHIFHRADSTASGVWSSSSVRRCLLFLVLSLFVHTAVTTAAHRVLQTTGCSWNRPFRKANCVTVPLGASFELVPLINAAFVGAFLFLYIQKRFLHESSVCVRAIFPSAQEDHERWDFGALSG